MATPNWKPIHPHPRDARSNPAAASSHQPHTDSHQATSSVSLNQSSRKNVSVACQRCQQKRVRCSGGQPCQSCAGQDTECLYAVESDARRKAGRKRKSDELQSHSDLLHEILDTVRESDDEQVRQVLSLIRSHASLTDLRTCIKQQRAEAQSQRHPRSPELVDLHEQIETLQTQKERPGLMSTPPPIHRNVLNIGRLTDSPPCRVPASPWTSVTSDDNLVSNLVSVWYTWDKSFHNWIEEDLFFHDMQHGNLESTYCSPFVVNALLSAACTYSDYEEAKPNRGALSSLMKSFAAEAKHLLEEIDKREEEPTITKAQGLAFMFLQDSMAGKDRVGYDSYMLRAASICQYLQKKYPRINDSEGFTDDIEAFHRALDTTCWGIFNIATMTQLICQMPQHLDPPTRPMPLPKQDMNRWWPYPRNEAAVWSYSKEQLHHFCELSLVVQDIRKILFTKEASFGEPTNLETDVFNLYERLLRWRESLPDHLLLRENAPDSVYTYQSCYLSIVMTLFTSLRKSSAPDAYCEETVTKARMIAKDAALEVAWMCRLHKAAYTNAIMNFHCIHPVLVALTVLMDEEDLLANRSDFANLCVYLRATTHRWPFAIAALRMFQLVAREQGKQFPPDAQKLFDEFESNDWDNRELEHLASAYPAMGSESSDRRLKAKNLSEFFDLMDRLDVSGK